jgi:hypothetical protein
MFTLTQTGTTKIKLVKDINIKTSKQLLCKLCFTVEQPLIHETSETAGLFPVKIRKKPVLYFCKLFNEFKTKKCCKTAKYVQNTSFQNEKRLLYRQSLYSRMRITSKTVHDINKMEDNFALRYVFTYPGIISCAEL